MNNSRILTIKNPRISGYYFYLNLNIWGDFQICISVPLKTTTENFPPSAPALNNDTKVLLCIWDMLKMNLSQIFYYGELSTAENWDTMIFLQMTLRYNFRGSTNHGVGLNMLAQSCVWSFVQRRGVTKKVRWLMGFLVLMILKHDCSPERFYSSCNSA